MIRKRMNTGVSLRNRVTDAMEVHNSNRIAIEMLQCLLDISPPTQK